VIETIRLSIEEAALTGGFFLYSERRCARITVYPDNPPDNSYLASEDRATQKRTRLLPGMLTTQNRTLLLPKENAPVTGHYLQAVDIGGNLSFDVLV
jgi:hypothetical protein